MAVAQSEVAVANEEHVWLAKEGPKAWNKWWNQTDARADVDLSGADLSNADLNGTTLIRVNLSSTNLSRADLSAANLSRANLSGANLSRTDLSRSRLSYADLNHADLSGAILTKAQMIAANLTEAVLNETVLADLNLASVYGLESCVHTGPSNIDHRTLKKYGPIPLLFLRGVGLPDHFIEYLPALFGQPIHYYSCFISYSSKDNEIASRFYADLQNMSVRTWFAPHDLPIGAKTWDAITEAIKLRDKVLLILSEHSITSAWVEDEIMKVLAEERDRGRIILYPVRIDDSVMVANETWARKLRDTRNIGDFRDWKDYSSYQRAISRLARDLTISASIESERHY